MGKLLIQLTVYSAIASSTDYVVNVDKVICEPTHSTLLFVSFDDLIWSKECIDYCSSVVSGLHTFCLQIMNGDFVL